jgi:molybdate transport system ATP-binding protein
MVDCGPAVDVLNRLDRVSNGDIGTLLEAEVAAHDPVFGLTRLHTRAGEFQIPAVKLPVGTLTRVRIRPEDVMLAIAEPAGVSALNILHGSVVAIGKPGGASVEVTVECNGQPLRARVTRRSLEQLALRPGVPVYAIIKAVALDAVWLGSFQPDDAAGTV